MQSLAGHFRTTALLKSGHGVDTFLGLDVEHGTRVIIKKARSSAVSPAAQQRLEHEADVLRELSRPSLGVAPPIGVGRERGEFFLVAPYVPGTTLAERLTRGPLDVRQTLVVARGLMRALSEAHEHGIIHRDIKPANVVLGAADRSVTLIDFGFARTLRVEAWLGDEPVGTIAYVSPEQAGLINVDVGERADLYSAGVVLFECLAGKPPFRADTVGEMLRQHATVPAPRLRSLGLDVPRALDAVVQRLLRKDPRDRYQLASAVLMDLDAIERALDAGDDDPTLLVGARDRRHWLTEPAFVGRQRELRALESELRRARAGAPRLVFVEAESGAGKTRLLEEMGVHAAQLGAWVLEGQATIRGVRRPLEILQGVAREVVARVHEEPELAEALAQRLGEHLPAVCDALPILGAVLAPERPSVHGVEAHGEARSIPALTALLDALGSSERMAVIVLDDGQSADEVSLKVLSAWQKHHAAAASRSHVLVAVAYRGDDVDVEHPLRRIVPGLRIELSPLAHDDIQRLTESMAGKLPGRATELVARLSQGNPFFAVAALEGLVEGGALVADGDGWEVEPRAMEFAQSSTRGASFLATRVERLPESVIELLSACAILGKSFELSLAADLAGRSISSAMPDIVEARRRHLVWAETSSERYAFAHDRVRERLLERLTTEQRRRLHRLAAERLEAQHGDEVHGRFSRAELVFDLAYHFDEAGERERALPYALEAAVRARAQYAFEIAERHYRIAERGVGEHDREQLREIREALGDVLMLRGKYDDAATELAGARALAASPIAEARIDGRLGELSFKRGRVDEAGAAIERALATLGRKQPKTSFVLTLAVLGQALLQVLHTLLPRAFVGRSDPSGHEADILAMQLYSRLAYAYWFYRGQVATFFAHLSELNLAERYRPTRELAQAYSEHALGMTGLPRFFFRRGRRYAERAIAIRRSLRDVPGEARAMSFYGLLLHAEGRYPEALERFKHASRVLRRVGDLWEANIADYQIASCLYRLGSLREAVDQAREVVKKGAEIGDAHACGVVLEIWAKASGGAVPVDLIEAALARSRDDPQTLEAVLQAEGMRLLRAREPSAAAAAFEEASRVVTAAKLESEYVSYVPLWCGHAARIAAEQVGGIILAPRVLPETERAIRRGVRSARRYRGNLPMALREKAILLARRGAIRRAQRAIDRSLEEAEALSMRFEYAQSLLVRGELHRVRGLDGAADEIARARALLHELDGQFVLGERDESKQGPTITLSLADRFASVVDAGRKIAAALTPDDIYQATCAAASTVLRGQSSTVLVPMGSDFRAVARAGRTGGGTFSRALAKRALRQSQPVTWTDALTDDVLESVTTEGVRSALCAPILARGRAVACLYVAHELVGSLFGDDERRLAEYIVALAGASLERADAFAELHALSRSLEQRVRDRTAELRAANEELDCNLRRLRETQEQLLQTGKMAAMGTLIAGLSHEINNPIAVILAQSQSLLRKAAEDDPSRAPLEAIGRQATRCAALVRTMLDFTRKSSGTAAETSVQQILSDVAELAGTKARNVDVTVRVDEVPPDAQTVLVARTEIESALLNLVNNAIDVSQRGGSVRVGVRRKDYEQRAGVEICVEDHGAGIPADVLPRIFDPFFTTKPVGLGTGLGLSLALRIVEAHGGRLSVRSKVGEGTTMQLWLPRGAS